MCHYPIKFIILGDMSSFHWIIDSHHTYGLFEFAILKCAI